jgi:hypothetical protein
MVQPVTRVGEITRLNPRTWTQPKPRAAHPPKKQGCKTCDGRQCVGRCRF